MEIDLSHLQSFITEYIDPNVAINSCEDILSLLKSDTIDQSVSKYLYVTYIQSGARNVVVDSKLEWIKEIILGSVQKNIETKKLISQVLGSRYATYGGLDKSFYNIYPFEAKSDLSHPINWSKIWRLNKDFEQIHLTDVVDSNNLCSFNTQIRGGVQSEFMEFVMMFDHLYDQNNSFYFDFIEQL